VDEVGAYAQRHEGPVRLRSRPKDAEARTEADTRSQRGSGTAIPEKILDTLTQRRATFTELDIETTDQEAHHQARWNGQKSRMQVLAMPQIGVPVRARGWQLRRSLYDAGGTRAGKRAVVESAAKIASRRRAVGEREAEAVAKKWTLDGEQYTAFTRATGTDGFVMIEGLAGTGKSHSLTAIREAHEKAGWRVIGPGSDPTPPPMVCDGRDSGTASTVHLEL